MKPHLNRRHSKVRIIERKNGTIKWIIESLQLDSLEDAQDIIEKGRFLSKMFSGSNAMSAFELARGYTPSILGSGSKAVTKGMLHFHTQKDCYMRPKPPGTGTKPKSHQ